jgi:hypothetical protein
MAPGAIDAYRRQIEKELQAGNATAGGAESGFSGSLRPFPQTGRLARCAGFVKPQRGELAKPRPAAWVRESVFSDASPERAKERGRTPTDDRLSRLIYYAPSGLANPRGANLLPRPAAWVRESVFSDASPERAKQRCGTRIDDRLSRLIYYARSGLAKPRGANLLPRPAAWVRESVFSDASPERAK